MDGSILETLEYESHWTKGLIETANKDLRKRLPQILKDSEVPASQVESVKVELEEEQAPKPEPQPEKQNQAPAAKNADKEKDKPKAQDATEGEAKAIAAKRARKTKKRAGILELRVTPRVVTRDFHYEGEIRGALRTIALQRAAALSANLRWYPAAHFTQEFWANIGLTLGYEHMFGVSSYMDARPFPTESSAYDIGTRVRLPVLDLLEFGLGFGYGRHQFIIAEDYVPDTDYHYLRLNADASLRVSYFAAGLGLGTRMLLKTGQLATEEWFPRSSVATVFGSGYADGSAYDAEIWGAFVPVDQLYILIGARWLRYSVNLNSREGDINPNGVAARAVDTNLSLFGGLELRL
jgi:hypothetical protein